MKRNENELLVNAASISRRGFIGLGGVIVCAAGLGNALPIQALADENPINTDENDEYTFLPEDALTEDDLPAEIQTFAAPSGASVICLGGEDRYATVAKEALYAFPSATTAVVTSGVGYADSIAAAGLAGALECPILLTNATYVPDVTLSALQSMGVSKIVLLGSETVANASVLNKLKAFGSIERVYGSDRYETQMAVYEYGSKHSLWNTDTVIVAAAIDFADALSAAPIAYALKAPTFFCDSSRTLPSKQLQVLSNDFEVPNFLLIGSPTVTSTDCESFLKGLSAKRGGTTVRLGGSNRYETSMAVAEYAVNNLGFSWDGVAFASGQGPYDALGGGPVQGKEKSVLLLADSSNATSVRVIKNNGGSVNSLLKFFGSTVVIPGNIRSNICSELGIPYYVDTTFTSYNISRSTMAQLQVNRNEKNGYSYNDFYKALDPDQYEYGTSSFYLFAVLNEGYSGMSASSINSFVANNCIYQEENYGRTSKLRNLGNAFIEAAKTYGVNETYLLAHAIWESAWGCSNLASGWTPKSNGSVSVNGVRYPYTAGTTYYNFYGIGAVDDNAFDGGITLAVKEGWTSPTAAVLGAAKWISANYLNRSSGAQNTLYLMKWDVPGAVASGSAWHEYCTGLDSWCVGIARLIGSCYSNAGWGFGNNLRFNVPVYS